MPPRFTRRLSPLERLWLVADRITPPFVNQLVLEGEGEPDERRWREAARDAGAANPGSQLVLRGRLWWARWVDRGEPPPVRVVDGNAWDGHSPDGADFLAEPLPPRSGPTTEILLVRGAPPRVVVRSHHAVMDGGGHLHFVRDLFRLLRGERPLGASSTLTDLELARRLGATRPRPEQVRCLTPTGPSRGNAVGVTWRRLFVPGRHSHLLSRIAVSVARLARAHAGGRVQLGVPVDMRQHFAEALGSTANLTGMLRLDIEPDTEPAALAAHIRTLIAAAREAPFALEPSPLRFFPLWLMRAVGRLGARRAHRQGQWISSGAVSNLGKLPHEDFRGGGFHTRTGFFIPPGTDGTPFFLALAGRADGVELCLTVPHRLASGGRLDACLARIAEDLSEAAPSDINTPPPAEARRATADPSR